MKISLNEVWERISDNKNQYILITSHAHPDGDSICSQMALYFLLKKIKKEVYIFNNDPVPKQYQFLPETKKISTQYPKSFKPDLVIVLDVIPWERLGQVKSISSLKPPLIIMDHHIYDSPIEYPNYINEKAAATAEIIYELYQISGIPISSKAAKHLYTGLLTDTGRFRFSNTSSSVFKISSELVKYGAIPEKITREVYYNRPSNYIKNLAKVLNSIELYQSQRTLLCYFTMDMNQGKAIRMEEAEGFLEVINSLRDIDLYVFVKEYKKNEFKLSFRSRDPKDARSFAARIGGGGHKHAAGAKMSGPLREIKMKLYHLLELL